MMLQQLLSLANQKKKVYRLLPSTQPDVTSYNRAFVRDDFSHNNFDVVTSRKEKHRRRDNSWVGRLVVEAAVAGQIESSLENFVLFVLLLQ